jgi:hypothetical protein
MTDAQRVLDGIRLLCERDVARHKTREDVGPAVLADASRCDAADIYRAGEEDGNSAGSAVLAGIILGKMVT